MKSKSLKGLKKGVAVFMACALAMTAVPAVNGAKNVKAAEATTPLTTVWNTSEVGTHTTKGSYTYNADKSVTVVGAGSLFDKGAGTADDFFYAYFNVKGKVTLTAKMELSNPESVKGYAGIVARNSGAADEPGSASVGIYADYANGSKDQIRYGYHKENGGGGASKLLNGSVTQEAIYLKMEIEGTKAYLYQSTTPDFSAISPKGQEVAGLDVKTIGFFATDGITATFKDVKITSEVTEDGVTTKKVVFDSNIGELIPTHSTSAEYSGIYEADTSFTNTAAGNAMSIEAVRPAKKGNIRDDKSVDYILFPAVAGNYTVSADILMKSMDTGTDKQGFAIGQFDAVAGKKMNMDVVHIQKTNAFQHTYVNADGASKCGNPKTAALEKEQLYGDAALTYTTSYSKNGNVATLQVTDASSNKLIDETANTFDLTGSYATLQDGTIVRYGMAFTGVVLEVTNLKLINSEGYVVYDQNDYYKVAGVAPIVNEITKAEVSADRTTIDLVWTFTEGVGSQVYTVLVSKDGGEYALAGTSKIAEFSYSPAEDGKYKFKVYGKSGDSSSEAQAKESAEVSYIKPMPSVKLTAVSADKKITLTWEAVEGATSYEVYRKVGATGEYTKLKEVTATEYVDTAVENDCPYTYYVVTKSATNSSNPSESMQALPTAGRVGKYEYGKDAAKITVVEKSNDTVMSDKATLKIKVDKAGKVNLYVNDKVVKTVDAEANKEIELTFDLASGRNDVNVVFEDADKKLTRKTFNFVSKPKYDIVVDSAYKGTDGEKVDGYPTYKTVQAAVNSVAADNASAVVIFIKNGNYEERVVVTSPYISLLGEDAVKTKIFKSVAVADKSATGMWDRNVVYVDTTADNFTAENLTIENTFPYTNGSDQQADALAIAADNVVCTNIRLVGFQDTLLADTKDKDANGNYVMIKSVFNKCYITGNVDFIYGSGSMVFTDCDIVARYTEYKADGCFTAGRTYANIPYGIVFSDCRFLYEEGVAEGSYRLSRPWGPDSSTIFLECYISEVVGEVGYGDMSGNSYKKARFFESMSYGPGFVVNNDRMQYSKEETKALLTTINNDFKLLPVELAFGDIVSAPSAPVQEEVPPTGDASPIMPLILIMMASGMAVLVAAKKKTAR